MRLIDHIIKPSTRAFIKESRSISGYSRLDLLHGLIYARWPYLYIGIGTGEHPASKWFAHVSSWFNMLVTRNKNGETPEDHVGFADTYHGKTIPLDIARQLVSLHDHDHIHVDDLEQIIPYKRARSIILKNPEKIVVLDCPCRAAREHPCLPMDVCLIVGDPFASFVHEHQPDRSRWITSEEAIAILEAEDERGHVHHAFFKDAMLDRFYAICNCCECCCGAMQAQRSGVPMLASSGYVTQVDEALCIGCSDCAAYCQFNALEVVEGVNHVDYDNCMGCGVCTSKCEQGALSLVLDERKGVPLQVCDLAGLSR